MAVVSSNAHEVAGSAALTREKILIAAVSAFSEHGFSGATFRGIGEAAGVNFQSIRHHFGSKEKLWAAVVERLCGEAQELGLGHEQELVALPLQDQLRAQIRWLVTYLIEHPELNRILLREAMKDSERYRQVYPIAIERFQSLTAGFLGRLQAASVVRNDIPLNDLVFIFTGALVYRFIAPANSELWDGRRVASEAVIAAHTDALTRLLLSGDSIDG